MATLQIDADLMALCEWIAAHPKCSRGDIANGLHLSESHSTIYRRIDLAVQRGLVNRFGVTSNTHYEASDQMRIELLKKHLSVDHFKRNRVGYNEEFLDDYVPNDSTYLGSQHLSRLHARCQPGAAPIGLLNEHDVSMFMCDIAYASSRLEGCNYDHASTIQLAEHHIEKVGGSQLDKVMILNHRDAARYIFESTKENDISFGITPHVLRGVHAILSQDLLKDPMMCGGLRTEHVDIWGSSYIPPDVKEVIVRNFLKISDKASKITDPYEQSFFLLVHLPYLQPFIDCNKRLSRVACNIPLLQNGITPVSWMDVTGRPKDYTDAVMAIYEHNDPIMMADVYVDCFMRSTERFSLLQRQKEPDPIAAMYRPEIKAYLRSKIIDGVDNISPNVDPEDLVNFTVYIDRELTQIKQNEMLGVRYGLTPGMITHWIEAESQATRERMRD